MYSSSNDDDIFKCCRHALKVARQRMYQNIVSVIYNNYDDDIFDNKLLLLLSDKGILGERIHLHNLCITSPYNLFYQRVARGRSQL